LAALHSNPTHSKKTETHLPNPLDLKIEPSIFETFIVILPPG
jgi:hypothetical protein